MILSEHLFIIKYELSKNKMLWANQQNIEYKQHIENWNINAIMKHFQILNSYKCWTFTNVEQSQIFNISNQHFE